MYETASMTIAGLALALAGLSTFKWQRAEQRVADALFDAPAKDLALRAERHQREAAATERDAALIRLADAEERAAKMERRAERMQRDGLLANLHLANLRQNCLIRIASNGRIAKYYEAPPADRAKAEGGRA
jgi:hypothetical protein